MIAQSFQRLIKKGAIQRLFLWLAVSLASSSAVALDCPLDISQAETAKVRHVHDGDTLVLDDGRKLRLIGIDTPELARDGKAEQPFAIQARDQLRLWIKQADNRVQLVKGEDSRDRYGRRLVHVFAAGSNLNARLLQNGLAVAFTTPPNDRLSDCYHDVERSARHADRGLWSHRRYQLVHADRLLKVAPGFQRVKARINRVDTSKSGVWLRALPLQVFIPRSELENFTPGTLDQLQGERVILRGWVKKDRHAPTRKRFMRLRHPSAIEPFSSKTD